MFRAVRRVGIQVGIPSQLHRSPCVAARSTGKKVPRAKESCQLCRLTRYHGFKVLHFPVMQSLFSFVCVVEILAVPTTSLINNPRHLTFFVKYQFGEAKFSVARGGLKMTVPFMYKFQSLPNKFPMIF